MSEFWEFLSMVFDTWVEKVGIVLTVLPFIEKIPPISAWLKKKPILEVLSGLLWVIGLGCLFWGCYGAWVKERQAVGVEHEQIAKLQKQLDDSSKPNFVFRLHQGVSTYVKKDDQTVLVVAGDILNKGADSVADGFKAHYKSPSLDADVGVENLKNKPLTLAVSPEKTTLTVYKSSLLTFKGLNGIARGRIATGRLLIVLPGNRLSEIASGAGRFTVECMDYLGTKYSAVWVGTRADSFSGYSDEDVR